MVWRIDGTRARLRADGFAAAFDVANPSNGFYDLEAQGQILADTHFLAVRVPDRSANDPPVDAYVRRDELVAKYPPRSRDLVSHQMHYRGLSEPCGIELVLSAQTSRLDSDPCMEVFNSVGRGELLTKLAPDEPCQRVTESAHYDAAKPPRFFLVRPEHADVSLALFVHPTDFFRAGVRRDVVSSITFWVFPQALEKGVIRRALFQFRVVPRAGDDLAATTLLEQATIADPPLGT